MNPTRRPEGGAGVPPASDAEKAGGTPAPPSAPLWHSLTRRDWLALAGAALAPAAAGAPVPPAADPVTPEAQQAVDRGLAYLVSSQGRDGSFSDAQSANGNVAVTGLAGLALLAGGHHPGRGKYGDAVAGAARYVSGRGLASPTGYLGQGGAGQSTDGMYQHGFGALFLAEVCGTVAEPTLARRVRDALDRAVALTLAAQNKEGGWRYDPRPSQADVSVTVAQLMALRAAKNAGVFVPKNKADAAVGYIKACQLPDGGFCYVKGQGFAGSAFPRSAAALVGLYSAGVYEGPEVERGMRYLMQFVPGRRPVARDPRADHYFYGQYYAALATWTAGGAYWAEWFPAARDELVERSRQTPGRVWSDHHGSAYATAMACIVLQLPNNYLPILQR